MQSSYRKVLIEMRKKFSRAWPENLALQRNFRDARFFRVNHERDLADSITLYEKRRRIIRGRACD